MQSLLRSIILQSGMPLAQVFEDQCYMLSQLLRPKMKPELRKALEAELNRLNGRVDAIKVLLETRETSRTPSPTKADKTKDAGKTDGRSLRWKNATPEQRKAWANAI